MTKTITPKLLKRKKPKTRKGWKKRLLNDVDFKSDVSHFYSHVYAAVFGGDVCRRYKGDAKKILNGMSRNFHPDVVHRTGNENTYVEVKSNCSRDPRPMCGSRQLENYAHAALRDLDRSKRKTADFLYAFFRYDYSNRKSGETNLRGLQGEELGIELSKRIKDLVIIPPNLLFALFMDSRERFMDHSTSKGDDIEHYWRLRCSTMSDLRNDPEFLQSLKRATYLSSNPNPDKLSLKSLRVRRRTFTKPLYFLNHKVTPFQVIRYFNNPKSAWQQSFKQHHKTLLTQCLDIRDLFIEGPRQKKELDPNIVPPGQDTGSEDQYLDSEDEILPF